MELKEAILKRRSIRKFTNTQVSESDIEQILHAAMAGPSACNKQPWEFYVITSSEMLNKLKAVSLFTKMNSPLAIVVVGNLNKALPLKMKDFWIQDCSASTQNILLTVTDLGLGAVWCGVYPQERPVKRLQKLLNLTDKQIPLNIIFIGHPAEVKEPRDQYNSQCVFKIN